MEAHTSRIVLIGPEASGKTTLARELAASLDVPWTPEAARIFAESAAAPLSVETVAPIARLCMRLEDERPASRLIIRDTDLVSTVIYARHYYGSVEEWIVTEARARQGALYLLCAPDLLWTPDGVRDRPLHRERLFDDFRAELEAMNARVAVIAGAGALRRLAAERAVESLLSKD